MSRSTEFQRALDRHLGVAAALILAPWRPAATGISNPTRIGLIQPSALGDLIMASGLIAHINARYPRAEIHILHGASNKSALEVLDPKIIGHTLDFTRPIGTLKHIRSLQLDVLVDLVPWSNVTALICRFSGAPITCGFAVSGLYRHLLFGRLAPYSPHVHQSENFRALAALFGPIEHYRYELKQPFPKPDIELPYQRLIVCHMRPGGSQARAKSWPADRWVALANRLCADGYAVAFSGSRADRHAIQGVVAEVGHDGRQCYALAGGMSLGKFCFVLQHARLVISIDTSPLHLASAVGVPVVALHGPTRSRQWGVNSANACSIDAAHPAAGYMQFGFESDRRADEIMGAISVEQVYQAAIALLAQARETVRGRV
jgi:ADP-heptose:LPS heptosyltransferase